MPTRHRSSQKICTPISLISGKFFPPGECLPGSNSMTVVKVLAVKFDFFDKEELSIQDSLAIKREVLNSLKGGSYEQRYH